MKYTKPELFTEKFEIEDIITASSGGGDIPGGGEPPAEDPPVTLDSWEMPIVELPGFSPLG